MLKLDIQEYEKAKDGSSVTFEDKTDYSAAGFPARSSVALLTLAHALRFQCEDTAASATYLEKVQDAALPDVFTLQPASPLTANAFRLAMTGADVYRLYVFAVPKKGDLIEITGSDYIGQYFYDQATGNLVTIIASAPIAITDLYAQGYGYVNAQDLFDQETVAGGFLIPHFSYDYMPVTNRLSLLDANVPFGKVYVLNQQPYRRGAASWWMHLHRNRLCLDEHERKAYDHFLFDLEGAQSRFESEYYEDAAEIMASLADRLPDALTK